MQTDPATASVLEAVQEGLSLHRWFLPDDITEDLVRQAIAALMPPAGSHPANTTYRISASHSTSGRAAAQSLRTASSSWGVWMIGSNPYP